MKKVLITGIKSYIGSCLGEWLEKWPEDYEVESVDLRDPFWKDRSFEGYDAVFHVAGIAHQQLASKSRYTKINRDLAIETARKAKEDGVGRFIFMSTMAVYGVEDKLGVKNEIGVDTRPRPRTNYGISKYEAEQGIEELRDARFSVCVVRPPMIYGENCPGNYRSLRKLTMDYGVSPDYENERSMIYIGNFCEFIRLLIDMGDSAREDMVFCPQDSAYHCTAEMMEWIGAENSRPVKKAQWLGTTIRYLGPVVPRLRKAFGNLTYARELSGIPFEDYCGWNTRSAVRATESNWTVVVGKTL
ncbi:MAG: NAD-dependent epimerase/dehydratase family protein [Clostridiales bacterium]|nr:NAD-dependent epimerase/dehydratase family protein [Clostridiales bacterium]